MILTRRLQEAIYLDTAEGRIEIKVLGMHGGRVQLGVTAPESVGIVRDDMKSGLT